VVDDAQGYLTSLGAAAHHSDAFGEQAKTNGYHQEKDIPYLLTWSANDEIALQRMTIGFGKHAQTGCTEAYLQQLAYTLSSRRSILGWRSFSVLNSIQDLKELKKHVSPLVRAGRKRGAVFVLTGQGAQYRRMGLELLDWPEYKVSLERFNDSLQALGCSWSVLGWSHQSLTCKLILMEAQMYFSPKTTKYMRLNTASLFVRHYRLLLSIFSVISICCHLQSLVTLRVRLQLRKSTSCEYYAM
jgi:hypothetical protein